LPQFGKDLRHRLEQQKHTRMIAEIGVEEILEKLAWKNAYHFARTHLPAAAANSRQIDDSEKSPSKKKRDLTHA
jgi:hypothetical protein